MVWVSEWMAAEVGDGARVFQYVEMDWPNHCATQHGAWTNRPLKCGNLQYKWTVLIWWVDCCTLAETTYCEILFVTLCSLILLNPLPLTPLLHASSLYVMCFFHLYSFLLLPLSPSQFICPLFSPSQVFRAREPNRQRLSMTLPVVLKSAQLPPTVSSLLPPSPPSSQPQFTQRTEMLIRRHGSACNFHGTPYEEQRRQRSLPHDFTVYVQLYC